MAGCYGNSAEDRAREQELYRYLDAQDEYNLRIQRIDDRVEELWESCAASTEVAYSLDFDYEPLVNAGGFIINAVAHARATNDHEWLTNSLVGVIGECLRRIAESEEDRRE